MSKESVQSVIGRALTEPDYRNLLFKDPEKALEGLELTAEEAQDLKKLDPEKFDLVANLLEERISKTGLMFTASGCTDSASLKLYDMDLRRLFGP